MSDAAVPAWIYEPALAIPTATIQQYVLRIVSNHSAIELLVLRGDYSVARFDSIIKLVSQQAGLPPSFAQLVAIITTGQNVMVSPALALRCSSHFISSFCL
jgi:hypothetical protein